MRHAAIVREGARVSGWTARVLYTLLYIAAESIPAELLPAREEIHTQRVEKERIAKGKETERRWWVRAGQVEAERARARSRDADTGVHSCAPRALASFPTNDKS